MSDAERSVPPQPESARAIGVYRAPRTADARRIVYVWDADYPWDVRTEKICATLASAGHDVHIVARNRRWRSVEERLPEGTVHRMRPWRWCGQRLDGALGFPAFFSPRWAALLDRTVARVRPHLIVGRDLPLAPTVLWAGHRRGVPVMLDIAENYPAMMRMIFDAKRETLTDYVVRNPSVVAMVERWSLPRADRVLVVVDEMAARLERLGVPRSRSTIVSNTPPRSRAEEPLPPRPPRLGGEPLKLVYLGLLEVPRGLVELIDATALLRAEGVGIEVALIGAGRDAGLLEERVRRLGLGDVVRFLGFLERETALTEVGRAHVGVIPHHANEAWNTTIPNKLFDYMALGLPVLSSDAAPCARIVQETQAGDVFAAGDARALAAAVRRLGDDDRRRQLGCNGRRAIRERFHWERDADALLAAVDEVALR